MTTIGPSSYSIPTASSTAKDKATGNPDAGVDDSAKKSASTDSISAKFVEYTTSRTATVLGELISPTRGIDTPGMRMTPMSELPDDQFLEIVRGRLGELEHKYGSMMPEAGSIAVNGMEAYEWRVDYQAMTQDPVYLQLQENMRERGFELEMESESEVPPTGRTGVNVMDLLERRIDYAAMMQDPTYLQLQAMNRASETSQSA